MEVCSPPEFFHKNMSHEQLQYFSPDPHFVILARVQS